MDLQRKLRNRWTRGLILLLSSMIIATASAGVYNYLYMDASQINVYTAKVIFEIGSDAAEAGTSLGTNGTYVHFTNMSGWPNATRIYENATMIHNIDSSQSFPCEISVGSFIGASIDELYVRLFDNSDTYHSTVQVHGTSNSTTLTIAPGEVWRVEWRIRWSATATTGSTAAAALLLRVTGEGTGE